MTDLSFAAVPNPWLQKLQADSKHLLIAGSEYIRTQMYEQWSLDVHFHVPFGMHSYTEWLPRSANQFVVHSGRGCMDTQNCKDFVKRIFELPSNDVVLAHLPAKFHLDQGDGMGTWEPAYAGYAGVVYFPYIFMTLTTAQLYRLQACGPLPPPPPPLLSRMQAHIKHKHVPPALRIDIHHRTLPCAHAQTS